MKKLLIILLVGVLIIVAGSYHIVAYSYDRFEEADQKAVLSAFYQYDNLIYTSHSDTSKEAFRDLVPMVHEFFTLLPQDTMKRFENEGWKIIISSEKPAYILRMQNQVQYDIGGNTEHNMRLIYLYLNDNAPKYLLSDFIHEFAHYEDWEKGLVANSAEFQEIMDKNSSYVPKDQFQDAAYHLSSSREYFACCYKDFFLYGDYLKANAPAVYRYISGVVYSGDGNFVAFYKRVWNYLRE